MVEGAKSELVGRRVSPIPFTPQVKVPADIFIAQHLKGRRVIGLLQQNRPHSLVECRLLPSHGRHFSKSCVTIFAGTTVAGGPANETMISSGINVVGLLALRTRPGLLHWQRLSASICDNVCHHHRPERNQIDSGHKFGEKRWQKFPVPAQKVNQHCCDAEIE